MALDFKEVMDTVKEIDDKIPDEVKDKAKDLLLLHGSVKKALDAYRASK